MIGLKVSSTEMFISPEVGVSVKCGGCFAELQLLIHSENMSTNAARKIVFMVKSNVTRIAKIMFRGIVNAINTVEDNDYSQPVPNAVVDHRK